MCLGVLIIGEKRSADSLKPSLIFSVSCIDRPYYVDGPLRVIPPQTLRVSETHSHAGPALQGVQCKPSKRPDIRLGLIQNTHHTQAGPVGDAAQLHNARH